MLEAYIQQVNLQKFIWAVTHKMPLTDFLIQFQKELNKQQKHQMKDEADLLMKVLLYCIILFRKQTLEKVNHT